MRQLKRNKEEGFVNWGSRLMFLPYLIDGELHQARNVDEFIGDIVNIIKNPKALFEDEEPSPKETEEE